MSHPRTECHSYSGFVPLSEGQRHFSPAVCPKHAGGMAFVHRYLEESARAQNRYRLSRRALGEGLHQFLDALAPDLQRDLPAVNRRLRQIFGP